jgi:myo-inositol catabolism protein IolC
VSQSSDGLFILPCDHTDILSAMWEASVQADSDRAAWITRVKGIVLDGLVEAVAAGASRDCVALLMDDEFGAPVLERAKAAGIARIVPMDSGEVGPFRLRYGDDFERHIYDTDPDVVSALISYNPESSEASAQLRRFAPVAKWQSGSKRQFLLELQVLPADDIRSPDETDRWVAGQRPALIAQAMTDLTGLGVVPDIWKLQDCAREKDYDAIVAAARATGRSDVRLVVLGGGATSEHVDLMLSKVALVEGFEGFAVGRSVWAEPIRAFASGLIGAEEAARQIAESFLHFLRTFVAARAHRPRRAAESVRPPSAH